MEILNEKVKFETGKTVDEKKQKLIRRLTILVAIWGVLNLLFSSFIFGVNMMRINPYFKMITHPTCPSLHISVCSNPCSLQ